LGKIGAWVWSDTDSDGFWDKDELPKSKVTVYLANGTCGGLSLRPRSAITDSAGSCVFSDLLAGNYCLYVEEETTLPKKVSYYNVQLDPGDELLHDFVFGIPPKR
jgi:hypothetical protein